MRFHRRFDRRFAEAYAYALVLARVLSRTVAPVVALLRRNKILRACSGNPLERLIKQKLFFVLRSTRPSVFGNWK